MSTGIATIAMIVANILITSYFLLVGGGGDFGCCPSSLPHYYYTTKQRICQYLFEKNFFIFALKKKRGFSPLFSNLPF
jgi:hypothetical protein